LNSRNKETKLSPVGLASIGLIRRLVRLMANCSAVSAAGTEAFEVGADQKNVYLEGPTLKRMQILR